MAREALALTETSDDGFFIGDVLLELGAVLASAGRSPEARASLDRALLLFEAKGATALVERARERLAALPP